MWRQSDTLETCLDTATRAWLTRPFLTNGPGDSSSYTIWQAMSHKYDSERTTAQSSSAFKVVEIVARFTAAKEWNNASALVMNRAARTIQGLSADEDAILAEFHSRLTSTRGEEELQNVVVFWGRLCEYRSCWLQSSEDASQLLDSFKYHELWNDLTPQQKRRRKGWWSTVNTLLHKGAGWTHAAQAIMEYGLPRLQLKLFTQRQAF